MKALVTGSSGFIGRHFVRYLRDRDWRVSEVDIKMGRDARDFFRVQELTDPYDLVIHAAAVVGGRQTIDGAPLAQAVNLELDAAMFNWAVRALPGRVVYFSSSAAYPIGLQTGQLGRGLREEDIDPARLAMPDQLYGWVKLTGENLAQRAREQGVAVTVVRPFSGYGSDQDDSYPFPAFIDRALRHEDPFEIWGSGQQVRDFIHVDDIVGAVMALVEQELGGPFNLGTGVPTSMDKLAEKICQAAGYSPGIEYNSTAPTGVLDRLSDPWRLSAYYRPKIDLELGIAWALEARARLAHR